MNILQNLQSEFETRIIKESYARIKKCCSYLTIEELWFSPNENLVSVGNLILHLEGNVNQWICSGIGGSQDIRNRDLEFSQKEHLAVEQILHKLNETIQEANGYVQKLTEAELTEIRSVQCFEETVLSIIIHVIEHFSYHTGQITYYTKLKKNIDTAYYGGLDLNSKEGKESQ